MTGCSRDPATRDEVREERRRDGRLPGHGIAVVIGARIASFAGASEVLVSSTVKDLTAGSGLTFADAGERDLKGVPDRWRVYKATEK